MAVTLEVDMNRAKDHECKKTFRSACEILTDIMNSAEITGSYRLIPRERITWNPPGNQKICIRPSQGREVRVRIKPGGNGTAWEYAIIGGGDIDMESLRQLLTIAIGKEETDESHEVANPAPSPAEAMMKMLEAIDRREKRLKEIRRMEARIAELQAEMENRLKAIRLEMDEIRINSMMLQEEDQKDTEAVAAQAFVDQLAKLGFKRT